MFNLLALLDIRVFGHLYNHCDWPRTFFTAKVLLFSFLLEILRKYYEEVVEEVAKN